MRDVKLFTAAVGMALWLPASPAASAPIPSSAAHLAQPARDPSMITEVRQKRRAYRDWRDRRGWHRGPRWRQRRYWRSPYYQGRRYYRPYRYY